MSRRDRRVIGVAAIAIIVIGVSAVMVFQKPARTSQALLEEARKALASGNHKRAEQLALEAASCRRPSPWALLVAAEAALKTNRYDDALYYYRRIPREAGEAAASAEFGEAEMLCHLGRLSESEVHLRRLLARDPEHILAHYRLAFLQNITGRRWEAQQHLFHLIRNGRADMEQLLLFGNPQRQIEDQALLEVTARMQPDDPLPKLGAARLALTLSRSDEARPLLESVLSHSPNEPEAVVRWGQLLLEDVDMKPFIRWSACLPHDMERHPEAWMMRGQFAQRCGDEKTAARCFWEALRRDPEHQAACHQLGRTLTALGDTDRAGPFLQRAELLQRLTVALDDLFNHRDHLESMRRAALLTAQLGRLWEAATWSSIALTRDAHLSWAREIVRDVSPHLRSDLPQTWPAKDPARQIDLTNLPLPNWTSVSDVERSSDSFELPDSAIRFSDRAQELGIHFRYENSADDSTPGARIFETTGGGVGAIDYDVDGWPDLYFTQGGRDPISGVGSEQIDRLFRNRSAEQFEDVTVFSRLGDADFSQGLTVGDFDNDGFPDLYIANLGRNRLYLNRGDGTFADMTVQTGISESLWTTSCVMADLDGDGSPDLYDVNYCVGDLTRVCEKQGVTRSCSPRAFDPAPDRLLLSQGDGRLRDVTSECGIDVPNGYGLGIVALDLHGQGRLSLFVANDEVPNFLFVNGTSTTADSLRFDEQAMVAGVALDADGKAQACMGVASGDIDGDGMLDLFVTNFHLESNTLYKQLSPGQFADVTRTAQLRDPSFAMLGFGTQFLDADLDGWEDLIITNGHIDDLTSIGEPYQMPTQFFRNVGGGRFREMSSLELGPFFQTPHLGRGLARLDFNRDGREDVAVSHLREPASLLTNVTPLSAHYLAVQLRGTRSSRDAIGTTVEVAVGGRTYIKQLTAGDGYHACNERHLLFGLGAADTVYKLTVRWPGGAIQSWEMVAADQTVLIIEETPRLWSLSK